MHKNNRNIDRARLTLAAALSVLAVSAQAAFEDPATASWGGWSRGDAGTIYQHWDVFNDDEGATIVDTTPDIGSVGSAPHSVTENTGGAFLTGGGNIYSFSGATDFTVQIGGTAGAGPTRVALQLKTLGTEVAPASITLNGLAFDSSKELSRLALGGFGGAEVETLFLWTLADSLASYVFEFNSIESSMSLDQLAVDVAPVPLPAAAWLMLSATGGMMSFARRRTSAV